MPPHLPQALTHVFTTRLAPTLEQYLLSLLVATYQSGEVTLVRDERGEMARPGKINARFRNFGNPMGLANCSHPRAMPVQAGGSDRTVLIIIDHVISQGR